MVNHRWWSFYICVLVIASILGPARTQAQSAPNTFQVGLRFAIAGEDNVLETELTGDYRLPLTLHPFQGLLLEGSIEATGGWIGDGHENTCIASLGPRLHIIKEGFPVSIIGGLSPTYIGENEIGGRDLGSTFQFTTHAGLAWQINERWEVAYRFQHISNGGFATPNPGLNLHAIGLSWRF